MIIQRISFDPAYLKSMVEEVNEDRVDMGMSPITEAEAEALLTSAFNDGAKSTATDVWSSLRGV